MSDKRIIAVVGATGTQGGGLARAILDDREGPFSLRALTRDAGSRKARELAARGAEVVEADLGHEESVRKAFDGAYGAFVVTNYWAAMTPDDEAVRTPAQRELDQAEIAARAARDADLRHVVWSTLEDTRPYFKHLGIDPPTQLDYYKVPHFDTKGTANTFFRQYGVPTTFLETTSYYENYLGGYNAKRDGNGDIIITNPLAGVTVALVAAEDIGRTAYGIFQAGVRFISRTVSLAGTIATGNDLAATMSKVLGEEVFYRPISIEQMRVSGIMRAEETANTNEFRLEAADSYLGSRDIDLIRQINPRLKSFEEWVTDHKEEFLRN